MGVDLRGVGGCEHFNWSAWERCLEVARAYGWKPEGTRPTVWVNEQGQTVDMHGDAYEPDPDERMGYYSNEYQKVTNEDAAALAQGLNRALLEAPRTESPALREHGEAIERVLMLNAAQADDASVRAAFEAIPPDPPRSPQIDGRLALYQEEVELLRFLAEYAAKGEFVIG